MALQNIGPAPLTQPGIPDGLAFILWRVEWQEIQRQVFGNTLLPTALGQLRNMMGNGAPSDMSDFQRLVDGNAAISSHGMNWMNDILPAVAALGSDVYEFGADVVPIFYPPILTEAQNLATNMQDAGAKAALKQILLSLQQTVAGYQANAAAVVAQLEQYAADNAADQAAFEGPGGIAAYYKDNYGDASPRVLALVLSLQAARDAVKTDMADFAKDIAIAEGSVAFEAVIPIGALVTMGMIAAYMTKAEDAVDSVKKDQKEVDTLSAELQAAYNLLAGLGIGTTGIDGIAFALDAAGPAVAAVNSFWQGLGNMFGRLAGLTDTDLSACLSDINGFDVGTALTDWQAAAVSADKFRVNVFAKKAKT